MNLRTKFFIFLVLIPSASLLTYLLVSLRVFVQDKTNYILDVNHTLASSISNQLATIQKFETPNEAMIQKILSNLTLPAQLFLLDSKGDLIFSSINSNHDKSGRAKITKLNEHFATSAIEKLAERGSFEGTFIDKK